MMRLLAPIVCLLIPLAAAPGEEQVDHLAELVGSYGTDRFDTVEAIRFICNVQSEDRREARSWVWQPKADRVTLVSTLDSNQSISFEPGKVSDRSPESVRELAAQFRRDAFPLLLPLFLSRAEGVRVDNGGFKLAPMGRIVARELIVTCPSQAGGDAPADVYKLYVDDAYRIHQWSIHPGGAAEPALQTIWVTDEQVGPMLLCTRFRNNDAKYHLWFADVAVKTTGVNHWQIAKPIAQRCRTCP